MYFLANDKENWRRLPEKTIQQTLKISCTSVTVNKTSTEFSISCEKKKLSVTSLMTKHTFTDIPVELSFVKYVSQYVERKGPLESSPRFSFTWRKKNMVLCTWSWKYTNPFKSNFNI